MSRARLISGIKLGLLFTPIIVATDLLNRSERSSAVRNINIIHADPAQQDTPRKIIMHRVIEQALRDYGVDERIYIDFSRQYGRMNIYPKPDNNIGKNELIIQVNDVFVNNSSPEIVYALAARQIARYKRNHDFIHTLVSVSMPWAVGIAIGYKMMKEAFQSHEGLATQYNNSLWHRSALRIPMVAVGLYVGYCFQLFYPVLSSFTHKLLEMDADIASSIKLGTADDLMQFADDTYSESYDDKNYKDNHPDYKTKVSTLSAVKRLPSVSQTSAFFRSAVYKDWEELPDYEKNRCFGKFA